MPTDASDVTPESIIRIIEEVKEKRIPVVFAEPQFAADVLKQVARDSGVEVSTIRSTPDDVGSTYADMMRANSQSLVKHLR